MGWPFSLRPFHIILFEWGIPLIRVVINRPFISIICKDTVCFSFTLNSIVVDELNGFGKQDLILMLLGMFESPCNVERENIESCPMARPLINGHAVT